MASEGHPVVLVDVDETQVSRGMQRIAETLAEGVERRLFSPEQAHAIQERVQGSADFQALADCDLVVEAVFEDLAVKQDVFRRLDQICAPKTILATNTSSFTVTELAQATDRADRFLGLHYFYHPAKNRLVEVVPGEGTSQEALRAAWQLQDLLGKTPIHSEDAPGFVVNRYFVPWLNESVRLFQEGVADLATIEAAAKEAFRIGMGPFELMNITGMPIAVHAANTLGGKLGEFYLPAKALEKQVASGKPWDLSAEAGENGKKEVAERLLGVTFLVAGQLLDERVCSLEDCDIGARVGLRWARGPFELMNRHGVVDAVRLARDIAGRYGLALPQSLADQEAAGSPFPVRLVKTKVEDGVATITIQRPDAMNALNPQVMEQLSVAFDEAVGRDDVQGAVLCGSGKAFVAGADIRFFVRQMDRKDLAPVRRFTEAGQDLLRRIETCPKPVLARLDGLSLGGGSELALSCHRIVATERGSLGFPETGIGIYPGLGGTQRTPRRAGVGIAKYLVLTGDPLSAADALQLGLVDDVVPGASIEEALTERVHSGGGDRRQPDEPLPQPWRRRAEFFAANRVQDILDGKADTGGDADLERAVKLVRRKAPVALRIAEQLIEEGSRVSLDEGLSMELARLEEIFGTKDAYEGLSSLGRRRPEYQGA
jgi:enoyl-CoA hydratase/3-hydroxyacyl-CoA dehydrogenase